MADKVASPAVAAAPAVSSPAAQASPSKKAAAAKSKKPRSKPAHPRTSEMVNAAIKSLKERGGSSLQAIKKYVSSTYKLDAEKLAPFIKKYLKTAVASGALVQTKGKGASGSFKLSAGKSESATPKPKSQRTAAPRAVTGPKKAIAKKPGRKPAAASKKAVVAVAEKRKVLAKGPAAKPPKAKTPSKAKRASKAPTRKPKAPKPKKVAAAPTKSSPRKAIAPKRK